MRPALTLARPLAAVPHAGGPGADVPGACGRAHALPRGLAGAEVASDELPLTIPVERAGTTPWPTRGTTTWVPAALLLAAAGRCSCDDCCADLARSRARRQLAVV